jgi:arsenite methyltransferase
MTRKLFTPAQANRTLPLVRRIVDDILLRGRELRRLVPRHRDAEARERVDLLGEEIEALIEELRHIGCDYKDFAFDKGLVDFPGAIEGQPVLLCWRSDEPRVEWYHAHEAGFAGRKRIPESLLVEEPVRQA